MFSSVVRRSLYRSCKLLGKNNSAMQFTYKPVGADRHKEVLRHLQTFFYKDEPLSKAAKLSTPDGDNPDLEAYILSSLEENLSIVAVTDDDKIAGVMLNGYFRKGDKEQYDEKVAECKTENFRKICRLLCDVNVPIDLFSKFSVDTIFDARIVSVDSKYRQHKLGWELLRRAELLAKEKNIKVAKAEATGAFSQRIFQKLGFQEINEIVYDKYLDKTGKPVLKVEPPHTSVKLMYKVLN